MNKRIFEYLEAEGIFTLCTSSDNEPHAATCMYVFFPEENALVFSSEEKTKHIRSALKNNKIAGTILPSKMDMTTIKGIQFTGIFSAPEGEKLEKARKLYYRKFPLAHFIKSSLWMIQLQTVKMTDNTLGFGKKIFWELNAEHEL